MSRTTATKRRSQPASEPPCTSYYDSWCEFAEQQPEQISVACSATGRLYRNAAARLWYGVPAAVTLREDAFSRIHPEDRHAAEELVSQAIKKGEASGSYRVIVHGEVIGMDVELLCRKCPACENQCSVITEISCPADAA
jgi:hypothetical protein